MYNQEKFKQMKTSISIVLNFGERINHIANKQYSILIPCMKTVGVPLYGSQDVEKSNFNTVSDTLEIEIKTLKCNLRDKDGILRTFRKHGWTIGL